MAPYTHLYCNDRKLQFLIRLIITGEKAMKVQRVLVAIVIALMAVQLPFSWPAFGQSDEDNKFLLLYFNEDDLYVESSTRGRKSLTQAAENITIVTAQDIKRMNAHTLADVLNTVTGVQVFLTGGPGSIAQASIQGSENQACRRVHGRHSPEQPERYPCR